jgi:hypothetical protein
MRGLGGAADAELTRLTKDLAQRATPNDVDDRPEGMPRALTIAPLDVAGVVGSCAAHGTVDRRARAYRGRRRRALRRGAR